MWYIYSADFHLISLFFIELLLEKYSVVAQLLLEKDLLIYYSLKLLESYPFNIPGSQLR